MATPDTGVFVVPRTPWLHWTPLAYNNNIVGPQPPNAPVNVQQYLWSDLVRERRQPQFESFQGDRGQLCRVTLAGTCAATIYAYRLPFWVVPHVAQGV